MGDKLRIKMWETLFDKGLGALLRPWQIKREGRAKVGVMSYEKLLLAQAEMDLKEINKGTKRFLPDGKIVSAASSNEDVADTNREKGQLVEPLRCLADGAKDDLMLTTLSESINLLKTIHYAEDELQNTEQEKSEGTIDDDWFCRWREYAKKINSDDLQRLWGKVLADELVLSGSYSLRTLDFIRNLTRNDAQKIERLSSIAIDGKIIKGDNDILERLGINVDFLLEMEELGILNGVNPLGIETSYGSNNSSNFTRGLLCNNKILVVKADDPNAMIKLLFYNITNLGKEVLRLCRATVNTEYLKAIGIMIKSKGYNVIIADWNQEGADSGKYFNPIEL